MTMYSSKTTLQFVLILVVAAFPAAAQSPVAPVGPQLAPHMEQNTAASSSNPAKPPENRAPERVANYVLGAEDQIVIHAFQAEELSDKPIQIPGDGYISLPLVGRVKAAGLTVTQLEQELVNRLQTYVRTPQVSVLVSDYRSQPVSVVGAVSAPGVVQLRGRKNLVEVIALAGGLKADAGNTVTITREMSGGPIPLPGATQDANGKFSIAHVNLRSVMEAHNPQDNILIQANDVIMIPVAQRLYVVGEVVRPGAYELNERDSVSVLQVVALAGGLTPKASAKKAKILHQDSNTTNRTELPTNVKKILDGQAPDVQLHADDILFVPNSLPKSAGATAMTTALNMAGLAIFRIP